MAIVSATFTFALPEDIDSDQLLIYNCETEQGNYSIVTTVDYEYGTTFYEFDEVNEALWYKIRFNNSTDNESGPLSDPVYGGSFSNAAPFLAVSTSTDGANYASIADVYNYAGLTTEDIGSNRVSAALRSARAIIDYRTAEMDLSRFETFDTDTARRKYNASLRILKEAEINLALGNLYQNMSDDLIIQNKREGGVFAPGSVSIGGTSISGDDIASRSENILYLATLGARYEMYGNQLLASLDTNSVKLVATEFYVRVPRFLYPFNGWY